MLGLPAAVAAIALLFPAIPPAQEPTLAPAPAPRPAVAETPAVDQAAAHTLDTPIERLAADPAARAVLDRELPGLTTHERYDQFKGMSLKALKPFSGGMITDERLAAVEAALRALVRPVG